MPPFLEYSCLVGPQAALALAVIYAGASFFSGLSGFGFSAIGCLSLMVLPPQLGVAMLMALSLLTQAISLGSLWAELRPQARPGLRSGGVLPYLLGGAFGMPLGLGLLAAFGARELAMCLGTLLLAYAGWQLFKPLTWTWARATPAWPSSVVVGALGGIVGGFSAFPGSAMVVWQSLSSTGKQQGRALTQCYILWMQVVGLTLLALTRPELFTPTFWRVLLVAAPVALMGNLLGVAVYRRTGDRGYRRVTLVALALAGAGLLVKSALLG